MSDITYDGKILTIEGWRLAVDRDRSREIVSAIVNHNVKVALAELQALRDAGQVWTYTYMRFHSEETGEAFSLEDAVEFLYYGEETESLSALSSTITCPDGRVLTSPEVRALLHAKDDEEEKD